MNRQQLECLDDAALSRCMERLASAVLLQALGDVCGGTMRERRDAMEWISPFIFRSVNWGKGDRQQLIGKGDVGQFTFELCCRLIDRHPGTVRKRVLARTGIPAPFLARMQDEDVRERLAG